MTYDDRMDSQKDLVVGVGSALMDILVHEADSFVKQVGGVKGGMTYVEKATIDETVKLASQAPEVVPGGSACNTVVGIAQLGGRSRFVGKRGNGPMGSALKADLQNQGVEPLLFESDTSTGRVLSIITPDAQRSMLTYLGAASEARSEEINPGCFENAAVVHIEGYLLFNLDLMQAVLKSAQQARSRISLDLASFTVVEETKDVLPCLIDEYVDILIANEDEALAFTGIGDEIKALEALGRHAELAVLKLGARGSRIAHAGKQWTVAPYGNGTAVDTTGAGDLWAAGFLYGVVNGWPLDRCGELGSRCGHAVCQVVGANIRDEDWKSIRMSVEG